MKHLPKTLKHNSAFLSMRYVFSNESERDAFISLFPKFCGVKKGNTWTKETCYPDAYVRVSLVPKATVHGTANEAGLKRKARILKVLEENGFDTTSSF